MPKYAPSEPIKWAVKLQNLRLSLRQLIRTRTMFDLVKAKFHAWQKSRLAYAELSRLTNRELRDLGISRSDVFLLTRQYGN